MARRWGTSRTEAFSDGVFAIAITLLVLELGVPESDFHNLFKGILHQWPSYLAYATSFLTIGAVWLGHHSIFARLRAVNQPIMRLNLLLLMTVSFLPYPTRLVADAIRDANAERVAVLFYGMTLFATSVLIAAIWRVVSSHRDLLEENVTDAEVDEIMRASTPDPGFYIFFVALAIFTPRAAAFGYFVSALLLVLRARGEEHVSATR